MFPNKNYNISRIEVFRYRLPCNSALSNYLAWTRDLLMFSSVLNKQANRLVATPDHRILQGEI